MYVSRFIMKSDVKGKDLEKAFKREMSRAIGGELSSSSCLKTSAQALQATIFRKI